MSVANVPLASHLGGSTSATHGRSGRSIALRILSRQHPLGRTCKARDDIDESALQERRRSSAYASTSDACSSSYSDLLGELEAAAAKEIASVLPKLEELTEPFIAYEVARTLPPGDALFIGNSMPIRDMEAFGGVERPTDATSMSAVSQGLGVPVAANRGASGIDGVISSAAGYAFGLRRAVTLIIGDVSFLHDINGLNLLRTGGMQPTVTIVLINNGGGGIFDFLPIAEEVPKETFTQLWTTPQNVDLAGMCRAQGLAHQKVTTPQELTPALAAARGLNKHSVVEVVTSRDTNVGNHQYIQEAVQRAVGSALAERVEQRSRGGQQAPSFQLTAARWQRYSFPLRRLLTTGAEVSRRRGAFLELQLSDAKGNGTWSGCGEIAPLPGLHQETTEEAEEQLELLCHLLPGCQVPANCFATVASFQSWLAESVGVRNAHSSLGPSVLCGLEGALLSAVAAAKGLELCETLPTCRGPDPSIAAVAVNGLLDCQGSPQECAEEAMQMVRVSGFGALKIKVGRRTNPLRDAEAVLAVRQAVGPDVALRADANRFWSPEDAWRFSQAVGSANLQFIEEPVLHLESLPIRDGEACFRVALDESIDKAAQELLDPAEGSRSGKGGCSGVGRLLDSLEFTVTALVVKPAVVGGFSRSVAIAEEASKRSAQVIISSAFETDLGLSQYAHLAAAIERYQPPGQAVYHGLGTSSWFESNVSSAGMISQRRVPPTGRGELVAAIDIVAAHRLSSSSPLDNPAAANLAPRLSCVERNASIETSAGRYIFRVLHWSSSDVRTKQQAVLFLHGFLGEADDWAPIAAALSLERDCYAVDLPGHGGSTFKPTAGATGSGLGISEIADALLTFLKEEVTALAYETTTLVGYSMGARVALEMLYQAGGRFQKAVLVSGTAGIEDPAERERRRLQDDSAAERMRQAGLEEFLDEWYAAPMWDPLRQHPRFGYMTSRRRQGDAEALADVVSQASPGRWRSLWAHLSFRTQLVLVAGERDKKYVELGKRLQRCWGEAADLIIMEGAGHALPVECPDRILHILSV